MRRHYPPAGEGHPTVHRPHRAARGPRPPGRAGAEPALVAGTPRPSSCSAASTPRSGTEVGGDPVQLLGALGPERLAGARGGPATSYAGCRRPPTTCRPTSRATAGTSGWPPRPPARTTPSRRRSRTSRPEYGITAALPQYSGGLGILAGDHLKAASDLGVPDRGGRAALPVAATSPSRCPARAGSRSATRCSTRNGLPISLLREADGEPAQGAGRACRAAAGWWPRSGRRRSAGCRCCCSTPTSRTTSSPSATSPTGSTAAAASTGCCRRCCSASAASARCAPTAG